jgi:signal transduction histidine kinase/CheY-like chemotaxis protein
MVEFAPISRHPAIALASAVCRDSRGVCLLFGFPELTQLAHSAAYAEHAALVCPLEQVAEWSRIVDAIVAVAADGIPTETEIAVGGGASGIIRLHLAPVMTGPQVGAVLVWLDGPRLAAQEVRAEAERTVAAKSRFLAAASHDLRQPFQAMRFFHSVLADHVHDPSARRAAEMLGKALSSGEQLLNALLDISTLDAGTVRVRPKIFNIGRLTEEIAAEFGPQAKAKGLDFRLHPRDIEVTSDPILVERIIRNLLANAVHYTRQGGILVGVRCRGDRALVEVWDTGFGIPEDQLGAIFEEFHQLENLERDRAGGLGLGLAIVARLARLLAVPIAVRSRLGLGSVFSVALSLAGKSTRSGGEERGEVSMDVGHRTILVVDDDSMVLTGLQMVLETWGLTVLAAQDLSQVLECIDQDRPDVILSDLRLRGGLTGFDVVDRVRAILGAEVPAIILTGETGKAELAEGQRRKLAFLHKPVQAEPLKQAIARAAAG